MDLHAILSLILNILLFINVHIFGYHVIKTNKKEKDSKKLTRKQKKEIINKYNQLSTLKVGKDQENAKW